MWPFKGKSKPEAAAFISDAWSVGQGQNNGRPMFVRFNSGLQSIAGQAPYAYQVGCAVPLLAPNEHGLPTGEESPALDAIEDALVAALVEPKHAVLAVVITTGGMREFVFYAVDPEQVKDSYEKLKPMFDHELQLIIQSDPGWDIYASFTPAAD